MRLVVFSEMAPQSLSNQAFTQRGALVFRKSFFFLSVFWNSPVDGWPGLVAAEIILGVIQPDARPSAKGASNQRAMVPRHYECSVTNPHSLFRLAGK